MIDGRKEVIAQVERAVMSDRNSDYAPPEQNFQRIADLWNIYLDGRTDITPYDTSIMMVLVKVARAIESPHLLDHLVDMAGYAACAADVLPHLPIKPAEEESDLSPCGHPADSEYGLPAECNVESCPGFDRNLPAYQALLDAGPVSPASVATDGGLPGDRPALYEGSQGFVRDGVWHGAEGRKIHVVEDQAVINGVLVFN